MPRPKDGTFLKLIEEIDPRKVASIFDEYGRSVAVERWHWCTGQIDALAKEGRRMKAAGETWTRAAAAKPAPRAPAPVRPAAPVRLRLVEASPPPVERPPAPVEKRDPAPDMAARIAALQATVEALQARVAKAEDRLVRLDNLAPAAARPEPVAPIWSFPMEPDRLLKKARTTSIPTLALMLGTSGRKVRDAIEQARRLAA